MYAYRTKKKTKLRINSFNFQYKSPRRLKMDLRRLVTVSLVLGTLISLLSEQHYRAIWEILYMVKVYEYVRGKRCVAV